MKIMDIFNDNPLGTNSKKSHSYRHYELNKSSPSEYYSPGWRDSLEVMASRDIRRSIAIELKYRIDEERRQSSLDSNHGVIKTKGFVEDWIEDCNEVFMDDSESIGSHVTELPHMDLDDDDFAGIVEMEHETEISIAGSIVKSRSKILSSIFTEIIKQIPKPRKTLSHCFIKKILTRINTKKAI